MSWTILHTESSDGWGGQEVRILLEATEFIRRGHRVLIVCPPSSGLARHAREAGVPVVVMRMRHSLDAAAAGRLIRLIRQRDVELVITHSSRDSWIASFAARAARVRGLVRTRHLSVPISRSPLNVIYRIPDAIVTTAECIRARMVQWNGMRGERIVSIPTGVRLELFDPAVQADDLRQELGIPEGVPVVTKIGVLRSWKRHEVFLEGARRLLREFPEARFLVVGEGPRLDHVRALVRELGLGGAVLMTGYRADIPRILAISDLSVLTSSGNEGVPQAMVQSLAMEVPVVATDAGGVSEVVRDGITGLLVPPNDPEALADRMALLLSNREYGRSLARSGRKLVEAEFGLERMIDRLEELYGSLFRNGRRGREGHAH